MFIVISHWSGSRTLAHHQHCTLTEYPLRYPDVAFSCGDPEVIILQDLSLHTLQQVIAVLDVRMGKSKAQDVGLGGS